MLQENEIGTLSNWEKNPKIYFYFVIACDKIFFVFQRCATISNFHFPFFALVSFPGFRPLNFYIHQCTHKNFARFSCDWSYSRCHLPNESADWQKRHNRQIDRRILCDISLGFSGTTEGWLDACQRSVVERFFVFQTGANIVKFNCGSAFALFHVGFALVYL